MARRRPTSPPLARVALLFLVAATAAVAKTDRADVEALNVLFTSMNKPSKLDGWKADGGDPCDDDDEWKGIECSGSSVTEIDVSDNKLSGEIPYALPPNLVQLDLSSNRFSGNLPQSFQYLSGLKTLNLQNNKFTGWIPSKLKDIDSLKTGGNQWSSGSAPPGMVKGSSAGSSSSGGSDSGINGFAIGALVIAVLLAAVILLSVLARNRSSPVSSHYYMDESGRTSSVEMQSLEKSTSMDCKTPPAVPRKSMNDNEFENKLNNSRRMLDPISMVLAVKKCDPLSFSGSSDFMEIVSGISKLRHPSISEIVGYCSEPGHYMMVYEYQMNGSLYEFLHLSDDYSKPLTWDTRVRIALGTAQALEYLHETCSPPVIHKNVKSSNVLLDADLNPHLGDCGLAFFYEDPNESLGPGYSAPECARPSGYTMKSDVYSFGVVMLELLTSRKSYDSSKPRTEQSLVKFVTPQLHDVDALGELADPGLHGLYPPKSLSRYADVIARCVQADPEFRPSMSEVSQELTGCIRRSASDRRMGGGLYSASQRSDTSDW
ncbi:hypothetical protein ACQ4PT_042295 [Festuca glaucescens]